MNFMKKKKKWILAVLFLLAMTGIFGIAADRMSSVKAAANLKIPAISTAENVNVRTKAGTEAELLASGTAKVKLKKNQAVTIIGQSVSKGEVWYQISFQYGGKTRKGYVHSDYITLTLKKSVKAKIKTTANVKVSTEPGDTKKYLKINNKTASLKDGKECTVLKEATIKGKKWFQIRFAAGSNNYKGYIPAQKLRFQADGEEEANTGTVIGTSLNVRMQAGTDKSLVTYENNTVRLTKGQKVTILGEVKADQTVWYQVSFKYGDKATLTGYVSGDFVTLDSQASPAKSPSPAPDPEKTPKATPSPSPENTEAPVNNASPAPTTGPQPTAPPSALSDAQFEQALAEQGFPEDYKPALRALHEKYPYWEFQAFHTGLSWDTVISNENKAGLNLITNSKSTAWKSLEEGAYNWAADRFVPFDGSNWVTASKKALEYYMDPRNFLTQDGIFQFEILSYNSNYQTQAGIEKILNGTPLSNTVYTYNDAFGGTYSYTYSEIFLNAALYSGVNPYHLATRVKQEVITSKGFSSSVSGNVSGYEGLYNFYNIGASSSTAAGGSVAGGLKFARDGKNMNDANKALYMLPWNNHYNAIVGGAKYIGDNYINRGQKTVYLQKFNVTDTSTYTHQYMANVEAAKAEAQKIFMANQNETDVPVEFLIPVYLDMPQNPCEVPTGGENPNNWLSSLTVSEGTWNPDFHAGDPEGTIYTVTVGSGVESVTVMAKTASTTSVVTGTGTVNLNPGSNQVVLTVTAQNGDMRNYTLDIIRQ